MDLETKYSLVHGWLKNFKDDYVLRNKMKKIANKIVATTLIIIPVCVSIDGDLSV